MEWNDRWVGALAYVTFLPALVFLFLKQFQRANSFASTPFRASCFGRVVIVFVLLGLLASMFGWLFGGC